MNPTIKNPAYGERYTMFLAFILSRRDQPYLLGYTPFHSWVTTPSSRAIHSTKSFQKVAVGPSAADSSPGEGFSLLPMNAFRASILHPFPNHAPTSEIRLAS